MFKKKDECHFDLALRYSYELRNYEENGYDVDVDSADLLVVLIHMFYHSMKIEIIEEKKEGGVGA